MRAYKYRIYPNKAQEELIAKHFGCVRHVYNWALGVKNEAYKNDKTHLNKRAIQDLVVASKKSDKEWLKEVNSQSLLASLNNLDTAFNNFFNGRSKFPRFKSKHTGWQSFQCPQHATVDFENSLIRLPKIKSIKAKLHRKFEGKIKTVTVKRSPSGKYFASVLVDNDSCNPMPSIIDPENTIGIDIGLTHLLIDSDGNKTDNPKFQKENLAKLAVEQKKLSRCKKGSNNRSKQKVKVAIIHEKISNRRLDFAHKETARLISKDCTSYAIEDLNIKGMVKNRKLSRTINDAGWGMFLTILAYKSEWNGKNILKIGRFQPSSKICNHCGNRIEKMPLSVREWRCDSCQKTNDRDTNAAKNIRDIALADALGHSACIKSSSLAIPVSAGAKAKGADVFLYRSQEAHSIAANAA